MYLYLKAIHLIFVVTWFAGLFYFPRLLIYHAEANEQHAGARDILQRQFEIMQKRLWYGIAWPSCVLTIVFGMSMLPNWFPLYEHSWLMIKLCLVFGLFIYHLYLGLIRKKQVQGKKYNPQYLRFLNEVATLFLVGIIFLVILKDLLSLFYGILGLLIFTGLLVLAIQIYKRLRT